ncbi:MULTISPECIES: Crp/Fnr family transcriptional regulator [Sphingobacterium]|uniref:Crp/Fnr family transcriptional regulator n=1 Tax=Sphingobacterium TaxID=28453 RepID=UPI0010443640|nr:MULTISPECIES: hypothetical protein [Sphingobacterium]MCW2263134.1 hypothetical protein [Sphingobacterium kitahiroshimense]TCR11883.1 CRP-like cAMP-binding protein [Sphingobacterium sp. JUb78]
MDRFIKHLDMHFRKDDPCRQQLLEHSKIRQCSSGQIYCREDESQPYWCYVLDGAVGAYEMNLKKPYIHWVATQGNYFTGTKHEYSFNSQALNIQFLSKGTIACIPLSTLQQMQQEHPSAHHFVSIMRQRKSDFFNKKGMIMVHDAIDRYKKLVELMPSLCYSLTNKQLGEFLYIDPKTLYLSKKRNLYDKK